MKLIYTLDYDSYVIKAEQRQLYKSRYYRHIQVERQENIYKKILKKKEMVGSK